MMQDSINIISLGQCGSRIGRMFDISGVTTCYANFDSVDYRGLDIPKEKMFLIGETGTGCSFSKGMQLIKKYEEQFIDYLESNLSRDKLNLIIFGAGGGSGSSMAVAAVKHAVDQKYRVGVLATLPPQIQGMLVLDNALKVIKDLKDYNLSTMILCDNEYIMSKVGVRKDWWAGVNQYVFNAVCSMFDILKPGKTANSGIGSIDKGELMRVLQYGNGIVDVRVTHLDKSELNNITEESLSSILYNPMLIEGFNYKDTLAYILNIDTPMYGDYTKLAQLIFSTVQSSFGSAISKLGMFTDPTLADSVRITLINAGLKLPKAIMKDIKDLNRNNKRFSKKRDKEEKIDLSIIGDSLIDEEFDI
jgi:cell division GTPase FtsZ